MSNLRRVSFVLALLAGATAPAQLPYGGATAVAGYRTELSAEPLWLGNIGFGYGIEKGPPNSAALLLVSLHRQDQNLFGLQLYPSLAPGDLLLTLSGALDAAGRLFLPSPLSGPEIPALAGLVLHAQAAVIEPSGFGSTEGMLLYVSLHPMVAIASQTHGVRLVDLVLGTATAVGGLPTGTGYAAGVFANGGRDLFVATSNGLFVVDTQAPVPTATPLFAGSFASLVWDSDRRRLFANYPYLGTITVINGDRGSPGFGMPIVHIYRFAHSLALTADGRQLVLGSAFGPLERLDVDPASAGYLQPIPTQPSPVTFGYGTVVQPAHVAPDGSVVTIAVLQTLTGKAELYRFDAAANQWIDYDPALGGVQPLSNAVDPHVPQWFTFLATRNGKYALLAGGPAFGGLALDLGAATFTSHTLPIVPVPGTHYAATTPSGRYVLAHTPNASASELSLVDIASGAVMPFAALTPPHFGNLTFAAWR
jgi:hypothetical protein